MWCRGGCSKGLTLKDCVILLSSPECYHLIKLGSGPFVACSVSTLEILKIGTRLPSHYSCHCLNCKFQSLQAGELREYRHAEFNQPKGLYLCTHCTSKYHIGFFLAFAACNNMRLSNEVMHMEGINNTL